jgi:hypothetical protein
MPDQPSIPPGPAIDLLRTDESGDVDLGLLEHHLSLTPAQRLKRIEDFVNFIAGARRANGLDPWSATTNSSKD